MIAGAVLCVAPAAAQVLPFEVLGLKEGLPQSQVSDIVQDRDGYLWISTWGGLARYNGESFASYFVEDGLPSNRVQELLVDRGGALWIGTGSGLAVWRDRRLQRVSHPAFDGERCRALAEDADGRLWVGTDRGTVVREGGSFRHLGPADGATGAIVYDLVADGGAMLAATAAGLLRLRRTETPSSCRSRRCRRTRCERWRAPATGCGSAPRRRACSSRPGASGGRCRPPRSAAATSTGS